MQRERHQNLLERFDTKRLGINTVSKARHFRFHLLSTTSIMCFALANFAPPAFSQSATPGATILLERIVVGGSPEDIARERINAMPGGAALISSEDNEGKADVTIADTLRVVPGVIVQSFFGGNDQPRIQIRGSGLQQNPVERGILILRDGLPLNRADGSYIIGLADPRQAEFIEVFRGHTANRLGATVLGGAINFTSPNGRTSPGSKITLEAGSFGQMNGSLSTGGSNENMDAHLQISGTKRDGFRDYNESERLNINLNVGAQINENISTRLFLGYTDLEFDVSGPLTWTDLKKNPKQVHPGPTVTLPGPTIANPGPNVIRDQPTRKSEQFRIGSRTSLNYDFHAVDFGLGYSSTDDSFTFPIGGGIRDTEGGDASAVIRYSYSPDDSNPLPLFEATAKYVSGTADRENYQNLSGDKGALFGKSELNATTLSLNAGMHIPIGDKFTVAPAISYSYATRNNDDLFGRGMRPVAGYHPVTGAPMNAFARPQDTSYDRSYSGFSPSLGVIYDITPDSKIFSSVSRSFEPPTHGDLLATINGTPFLSPGAPAAGTPRVAFAIPDLEAQTATTIEAGWRGEKAGFTWNLVTYYSWVNNELLNLRDASGVSLGAVNADKTTHFGVELGAATTITDAISARLAYTYQDFRFDNDAKHGDNRLAGAPRHSINAALRYTFSSDFFTEAEINWRSGDTPVDNANTLFNEAWTTVDLRSSYKINQTFSISGEVRNVFDEIYASSTLITDVARADQAAFLPGDGRSFHISLNAQF